MIQARELQLKLERLRQRYTLETTMPPDAVIGLFQDVLEICTELDRDIARVDEASLKHGKPK